MPPEPTEPIVISILFSNPLFSAVFGAVTSALASYFIPLWIERRKSRRLKRLTGEWITLYHDLEVANGWIEERVDLSFAWNNTLSMDSVKSKKEYHASLKLYDDVYLTGTWKAIDNAEFGIVNLVVDPLYTFMYGFWSQVDEAGAVYYGGWIVVKDRAKIPLAKSRLRNTLEIINKKKFD